MAVRGITLSKLNRFYPKVNHVINISARISSPKIIAKLKQFSQNLANKMSSILIKGHNSANIILMVKKKNMGQVIYHGQCICDILQL